MKDAILSHIDDPQALEELYRSDKQAFRNAFTELYSGGLRSPLAEFWHYRLGEAISLKSSGSGRPLLLLIVLAACSAFLSRLPDLFAFDREIYYQRNIGFIVFPVLMLFYLWNRQKNIKLLLSFASVLVIAAVFINLLPRSTQSDTNILSCIHLNIVLWGLLGWAYVGEHFRDKDFRIAYLKYNGDLIVMAGLLLLAGLVLSGITVGMFRLLGYSIEQWYVENIATMGLAVIPLVATQLVASNANIVGRISPLIARLFSPLVVVMLLAYLIALFVSGKDPYNDREFLLTFNILLAGVMALVFFSVAETGANAVQRYQSLILFLLSALAVIVNGVALSAIAFRLAKYGFTPNRLAVTGANILFFLNLLVIVYRGFDCLRGRLRIGSLQQAIAVFLPAYIVWAAAVTFLFPLLFAFR